MPTRGRVSHLSIGTLCFQTGWGVDLLHVCERSSDIRKHSCMHSAFGLASLHVVDRACRRSCGLQCFFGRASPMFGLLQCIVDRASRVSHGVQCMGDTSSHGMQCIVGRASGVPAVVCILVAGDKFVSSTLAAPKAVGRGRPG